MEQGRKKKASVRPVKQGPVVQSLVIIPVQILLSVARRSGEKLAG